ncbi:MAG TPA: hypothetical protein VMR31_14840 [Myxococcota bacterium]|nr:hypothetical protein [Myxococcota bacterium]
MSRSTIVLALIAALAFAAAPATRVHADGKPAPAKPAAKTASLDQVKEGMSDTEVHTLLGNPSSQSGEYPSPKNAIPFYHGTESTRQNWYYTGKGSVIMMRNRYNGQLSVLEVHPDSSQP